MVKADLGHDEATINNDVIGGFFEVTKSSLVHQALSQWAIVLGVNY